MIIDHQKYIALSTKYPSLEFRSETDTLSYATITWLNGTYITETEYNLALAEYDAQEYARSRKEEYDALNQLEMQFDDKKNSTTTWDDAIDAIKAKWPKDNSGPV